MLKQFNLGWIMGSEKMLHEADRDWVFRKAVDKALDRFRGCDWGDVTEQDRVLNNASVEAEKHGSPAGPLIGFYPDVCGRNICIRTEADRRSTTIMFASEQ